MPETMNATLYKMYVDSLYAEAMVMLKIEKQNVERLLMENDNLKKELEELKTKKKKK